MSITHLRKKPITVKAIQFDGTNAAEIEAFTRGSFHLLPAPHPNDPDIVAEVWDKLHGTWVGVKVGNWIVCGPAGEHYPVDDGIRQVTYDIVDGVASDE